MISHRTVADRLQEFFSKAVADFCGWGPSLNPLLIPQTAIGPLPRQFFVEPPLDDFKVIFI
jgi:hypothetical protein